MEHLLLIHIYQLENGQITFKEQTVGKIYTEDFEKDFVNIIDDLNKNGQFSKFIYFPKKPRSFEVPGMNQRLKIVQIFSVPV